MRKNTIRRYYLLSVGTGIIVGLIFPPFASIFTEYKQKQYELPFSVLCIIAGVVVGLVSYLIGKYTIISSLKNLYNNFDTVGKGDFTHRMVVKSNDEIGQIATYFNKFVDTIENLFRQIENSKKEIEVLYKEIAVSEEKLRQQNHKLAEYNQEIKENEEKLNYIAHHDILTGLPNRKLIMDKLKILTQLAEEKHITFAVVFIDLDNFKNINDTMGHHAGDLVIKSVGLRLNSLIHKDDILGRFGGDEFALIIQQQLTDKEILHYIENMKDKLIQPLDEDIKNQVISASFGISFFPEDGDKPGELIRCADTAMYKAKFLGKNSVYRYRKI